MVLLLAVFGFRLFPERDVTVVTGGRSLRVSTTFDARQEALDAADVQLAPGDRVLLGTGGRHVSLAVQRARPIVVQADDRAVELRTQATTVSGALAEAGVDLRPGDRVYLDGQLASARGPLFGVSYAAATAPGFASAARTVPDAVTVSIVRARPVTVYVDTLKVETSTAAENVEQLLQELGLTVREVDLVKPALNTPLTAGMSVRLAKARTVNVRLDGKEQLLYTHAVTVEDVVRVLNVELRPGDIITPSLGTYITSGLNIVISLTREQIEEVTEPIQPPTIQESDGSLAAGTVRVFQGTPGSLVRRFSVTYKDGVEIRREEIAGSRTVVTQPVPTRQVTGTKQVSSPKPTLNAPGYTGSYKRKLTVETTWYDASHGAWSRSDPNYGRTASGAIVDYGICAVDPSVIPMGTQFYVPDYGLCIAADTGGAVRGNVVDLGFPEGVNPNWGRRVVEIYIIN